MKRLTYDEDADDTEAEESEDDAEEAPMNRCAGVPS